MSNLQPIHWAQILPYLCLREVPRCSQICNTARQAVIKRFRVLDLCLDGNDTEGLRRWRLADQWLRHQAPLLRSIRFVNARGHAATALWLVFHKLAAHGLSELRKCTLDLDQFDALPLKTDLPALEYLNLSALRPLKADGQIYLRMNAPSLQTLVLPWSEASVIDTQLLARYRRRIPVDPQEWPPASCLLITKHEGLGTI